MTRNNARELAVHLVFELSFSSQTADELLETALTRQTFAQIGEEEPLYAQFPNAKQREYISALVRGVWAHGAELDGYISKYAIGWRFSRLNGWRWPSCGWPCMRFSICRTSPTQRPSTRRWS